MSYDLMFQQALALHEQGRFDEAENLYRQILETAPQNPDVLNLLGLALKSEAAYSPSMKSNARVGLLSRLCARTLPRRRKRQVMSHRKTRVSISVRSREAATSLPITAVLGRWTNASFPLASVSPLVYLD